MPADTLGPVPKHDPEKTPPEQRRAPRGDIVTKMLVPLTAEAEEALEALTKRWECSRSEAVRRALLAARRRK